MRDTKPKLSKLFSLDDIPPIEQSKNPIQDKNAWTLFQVRRFVMFIIVFAMLNYRYWTGKQQYPLLCNLFRTRCPSWPIQGEVAPGYESVVDAFKTNFELGLEIGASFTAFVGNEKVVELYGGYKSRSYTEPYDQNALQLVFSSSKVVEGLVMAYLVEKELIRYQDRISVYWPEFAQGNKENVTLACLLGHRAGLTWLDRAPSLSEIADLDQMAKLLASQPHNFDGKPVQGYHAVTRGWYLNEIVRRVDPLGRSMGQLIKEEIMPTLGVEYYLGLPTEKESRVSYLEGVPLLRSIAQFLPIMFQTTKKSTGINPAVFNLKSIGSKAIFSQPRQIVPWPHSHNRKAILKSESPSFSGVTNSLSVFKADLVG